LGWAVREDYVGYLVVRAEGIKHPPRHCPECGSPLEVRGQAIVEFALVLPLILFIMLGFTEVGFLLIAKAAQDRDTAVIAQWAAVHPGESWNSIASKMLPGCDVNVERQPNDLVEATSRCQYRPRVLVGFPLFDGLPISSQETSVDLNQISGDSPS
jgi:hypothetical protein